TTRRAGPEIVLLRLTMAHKQKTGGDASEETRAGSRAERWSLADLFVKPKPSSHSSRRSHGRESKHGTHSSKPKHISHDDNSKHTSSSKLKHSSRSSKSKHSSNNKKPKAARSATTASASSKEHRKKRPTLVRRRTSPDTSVRKVDGKGVVAAADHPQKHSQRRRSSVTQPHQIHVDLVDSSDTRIRKPTKEKSSMSSDRSHSLFQSSDMPHFLSVLCGREKPSKSHPKTHKKKKTRSHHSSKHRSHRKGNATDKTADKTDKMAVQMSMPEVPGNAGADPRDSQSVHFSHPPSSLAQGSNAVHMPTPVHYASDGVPYAPTAADHRNLQDSSVDPFQTDAATRRNRVSTASGDEDGQLQVFQILGRRNTQHSRHAAKTSDAISPVLVTIARDGSIISDPASRQSEDQPGRPLQTNSEAPEGICTIDQVVARTASRNLSPSTSPAAADVSVNVGTDSFVTARMEPSTRPSEGPSKQVRRQSDEVSDIDMRRHLLDGDDQTNAEDQALANWLLDQTTDHPKQKYQPRHPSIAQTILRGPALPEHTIPATSSSITDLFAAEKKWGKNLPGEQSPQQRQYLLPLELHGRLNRAADNNRPVGVFEQLLARVTDLESQFKCMEAVMVSIEDKLTRITSLPLQSLSIRRPSEPRSSAGMTPEFRGVKGSDSKRGPEEEKLIGPDGYEDPTIAAHSAAATLTEIVNRSLHGFNITTANALSSIASLAKDIKSLDRANKTSDSDDHYSG
ncbi:hypothetical protein H4R24_004915, partial [Coemansia sp. RSA 988]